MRKGFLLAVGALAVAALTTTALLLQAQPLPATQRYEVAIIKWDGPDKLQFVTPQKSEALRLFKTGVSCPPDIHDEEFCMTWAANKLAQDGWEPVNLNATRMLLKRPVAR